MESFSSSNYTCVPGIKFMLSDLYSKCFYLLSHLTCLSLYFLRQEPETISAVLAGQRVPEIFLSIPPITRVVGRSHFHSKCSYLEPSPSPCIHTAYIYFGIVHWFHCRLNMFDFCDFFLSPLDVLYNIQCLHCPYKIQKILYFKHI